MLKMTLNAFWWVAENMENEPARPPLPPTYGKFHMLIADAIWKLSL